MAIEEKYAGSLDDPPPHGQTFAGIKTWEDLYAFVKELVEDNSRIIHGWWDLAKALSRQIEVLDSVRGNFSRVLQDLEHEFRGAGGEAVQARGQQILAYMKAVADAVRDAPKPIDNTGHDIVVYVRAFRDAKEIFDKLAKVEENRLVAWLEAAYANSNRRPDTERARRVAREMVERNVHIPHQRKLLMILADKYASKFSRLSPFSIQLKDSGYTYIGGSGSGSGSGFDSDFTFDDGSGSGIGAAGGSGSGSGSSGSGSSGSGSGAGNRAAWQDAADKAKAAIDQFKSNVAGAGSGGSGPGLGAGSIPGLGAGGGPGASSGGGYPGAGAGSPSLGAGSSLGAGLPSAGGGTGSGSSRLSTSGPSFLGYPSNLGGTGSGLTAEQSRALQDARQAAQDAIDALKRPGDSAERTQALDEAKRAVDEALDDLASVGLPASADRADTLRAARAAAGRAIDDLLDGGAGSGSSGSSTDAAAQDRARLLQQARDAAEQAIDDLLDQTTPSTTSDAGEVMRSETLEGVRDAVDAALDDLISDTMADPSLSEADKSGRADMLGDAKEAALRAVTGLPAAGDTASDLSRFLTGSAGSGGGISVSGSSAAVSPASSVQLGITPAVPSTASVEQSPIPVLSPAVDAAAQAANQGMPMAPPMGGANMAANQKERERSTWIDADPAVWQDDDDEAVSAQAIGRGDGPPTGEGYPPR